MRITQSPKSKIQLSLFKTIIVKDWTKQWAYAQGIGAALMASITGLSGVLSSSEFRDVLSTLSVPWWVPTGIAVLALISFLAYGRENA